MTERNSDIVKMISAAPLLCRVGGEKYSQWSPNMIWYDAEKTFLTPSYYVQLMYAQNSGTYNLVTVAEGEKLYANTVFDTKTGDIIIKIVNASDIEKEVEIVLDDAITLKSTKAILITLTGEKMGYNSIEEPCKIAPFKTNEDGITNYSKRLLPPYSFTIIRI